MSRGRHPHHYARAGAAKVVAAIQAGQSFATGSLTPPRTGLVLAIEHFVGGVRIVVETDELITKAVSRESAQPRYVTETITLTHERFAALEREFGGSLDNLLARRVPLKEIQ